MAHLKRLLIGILTSIGGVGGASIGGLPGPTQGPRSREAKWIDWGGSHRNIPNVMQSQRAYDNGNHKEAFKHLKRVRREVERGGSPGNPGFRAQLNNNLAVCAHNCGQQALFQPRRDRWEGLARQYIARAVEIRTSSREISNIVGNNHRVIARA
jgi:hypothetical protein